MIIDSNHRATGNGSRRRESSQVALRVVPRIIIVYRKNQDVDISQFTSWFLYCIAGNSSTLYAALYFTAFYQPCVQHSFLRYVLSFATVVRESVSLISVRSTFVICPFSTVNLTATDPCIPGAVPSNSPLTPSDAAQRKSVFFTRKKNPESMKHSPSHLRFFFHHESFQICEALATSL